MSLALDPPVDVDHLVALYDSTSGDIVDEYAPLSRKEMPRRPMFLWYNKSIELVEESCISMMDTFEPFTETDIRQLLKRSSNVFCAVDPMST